MVGGLLLGGAGLVAGGRREPVGTPRWPRPRTTRAPSPGTSGRPRSPRSAAPAGCVAGPPRTPPPPTPTSRPGSPHAQADTGSSNSRGDSPCSQPVMHPHREVGPGVLEQIRVRNPAQHAWDKETSLSQPSQQGVGSSLWSVDEGRQVDEHEDILTRARRAYAAQDWRSAAARFDAVPPERLTADDLAAYADAVWWLGRIEDNLRLGAAACDAFLAESRPAAAVDAARRVQDLGRRVDAPDLVAVGMNGEGRALIRSGHLVDGLALLDEAMVTVLDGQLAPFISGTLYCHTIAACHEVADVRRMTRWTDLAERWLTTFPAAVFFGGLCGVHRAQLLLLRGEWDEAEQVALRVVVDLDANRIDYAAEAWYVVA